VYRVERTTKQRYWRLFWLLYALLVVVGVGYFSLLLGVFATDAPGVSEAGGFLFGMLLFAMGLFILLWVPYRFSAWLLERRRRRVQ